MASLNNLINDLTDFYLEYSPFEFSWEYSKDGKGAEEVFTAKMQDGKALSDEMENLNLIIENLEEQVEADPDDDDFQRLLRTAKKILHDYMNNFANHDGRGKEINMTEVKAYTATDGHYTVMVTDDPGEEYCGCFLKKAGYPYFEMFNLEKPIDIVNALKISLANAEDYEFLFDD